MEARKAELIADGCDVPLCVYLALAALTTHKGGNDGGRSSGTVVRARTPTPPPFGGGRPSSGGAHIGPGQQQRQRQQVAPCTRPYFHAPTFRWGTSKLRAACAGPSKRHQLCTPELPRPHLSAGVVRATRRRAQRAGQRHEANEGGVMRDVM